MNAKLKALFSRLKEIYLKISKKVLLIVKAIGKFLPDLLLALVMVAMVLSGTYLSMYLIQVSWQENSTIGLTAAVVLLFYVIGYVCWFFFTFFTPMHVTKTTINLSILECRIRLIQLDLDSIRSSIRDLSTLLPRQQILEIELKSKLDRIERKLSSLEK